MKKIILFLPILSFCLFLSASPNKSDKVYVASFAYPDPDLEYLGHEVAIDFQTILLTCKKRFKVYERRYYTSWLAEDKSPQDELKQEISPENIDYLVFGAIVYDKAENRYVIEYGFEEVNTSKILIVDNVVCDSKADLLDASTRLTQISYRIIDEFALCSKEAKPKKEKTKKPKQDTHGKVVIKERVNYKYRDRDKDGIPDLIDMEKNSPIGAIVNARGVMISKEVKEKMTKKTAPTRNDTNDEEMDEEVASILAEMVPALPTISFTFNTNRVEEESYAQLHHVAMVMRMYPAVKIVVIGNTSDTNNTMAYNRALNTIEYLINNYDILPKRFALRYKKLEEEKSHTVKIEVMTKRIGSMKDPDQ